MFPAALHAIAKNRQTGGAVLAVIAGLLVVAASTLAIRMARQVEAKTELVQLTQARMQRIQAALHAHAASQGRLPCPSIGDQDLGLAEPAAAVASCPPTSSNGAVPWVTLGLRAEDALDGWGRKISYRVPDSLVQGDGVKSADSLTIGLQAQDYGVNREKLAWVLISHGASGLGAWRTVAPRMVLPGAGGNEWNNSQSSPTMFFRRGEVLVNPTTGVDYVLADVAHFDDVLHFESLVELREMSGHGPLPIVGAPPAINLTKARLDTIKPVIYSGQKSNTNSIEFDGGTSLGKITVSSKDGDIALNIDETAIGVCTGTCNGDSIAALENPEEISFKLDGLTAGNFALGVISLDPTIEMSLIFKSGGAPIGSPIRVPLSPPPPASPLPPEAVTPGVLKVFENLQPSPATPFDEVVIKPLGSSRFFIASIRFCTAAENCN